MCTFRQHAIAATALLALNFNWLPSARAEPLPTSGLRLPQLAALDAIMQDYMQEHGIGAGVAAVMRNGVPVYRRAFGWQDEQHTKPLAPDAIMRLASVTKPITAAAVRKLISQGKFGLNSRVFSAGEPGTGLLDFTPFGTADARLKDITVEHLLRHRGGWNRSIAGDLTYRETQIASAMSLSSPPGREATLRWILGQPLQFTPGTQEVYSNIGALTLGLVIEKYAGMPYIDFVRQEIFAPLGVPADQVVAGRTFREDHDPREPFYDASGDFDPNVFWPARGAGPSVPAPYGGWDHEARIGQGGVVADPLAILALLNAYQVNGPGIGGPRPAPGTWRWNHTGGLQGTSTLARQRGDGINYVVLFNKDATSSESYAVDVRTLFDAYFDQTAISWPTQDITTVPVGTTCDFNADGFIDGEDLTHWRLAAGRHDGGDADGDGDSDGADFLAWQRSLATESESESVAAPEPIGVAMMLTGAAATLHRSWRARRGNMQPSSAPK
jgi:CubicO group peptidase (beta-lactamase class C family)